MTATFRLVRLIDRQATPGSVQMAELEEVVADLGEPRRITIPTTCIRFPEDWGAFVNFEGRWEPPLVEYEITTTLLPSGVPA